MKRNILFRFNLYFGMVWFVPGLLFLLILSGCESKPSGSESHAGLSHPLTPFSNQILQDSLKVSGNRLTLVNFYATWCRPCVKEIPDLIALQQKYPNTLRLMMVSIDDQEVVASILPEFLVSHQIPFATWYAYGDTPDASNLITSLYPSWNSSIPLSLLYDSKGNLLQVITGQIDPAKMNEYIQSLTL